MTLTHTGRPGDAELGLSSVALRLESSAGVPLTPLQAVGVLGAIELYRDSGSGVWEPGDELVGSWSPTAFPADGQIAVAVLSEGAAGVRLAVGESKSYFVVLATTSSAAAFGASNLLVTHLSAHTVVEDRSSDSALLGALGSDSAAGPIALQDSIRAGDTDGDGDIDLSDLGVVLAAYGGCFPGAAYVPAADFDGTGCIDLSDLGISLAAFGT